MSLNQRDAPMPTGVTGAEDLAPRSLTCSLDNSLVNAATPLIPSVGLTSRTGFSSLGFPLHGPMHRRTAVGLSDDRRFIR